MLIYEKRTEEERKIYGTLDNIPSDSDEEVVCLNEENGEIKVTTEDGPFTDDGHGGIVIGDGTKIKVQVEDTVVIPRA